jgi:D-alanyl-lipoteichoic acid acyltransferase DltB (MBOAT superfamily)
MSMLPFLDPLRPTALPAILFLVWLPLFLLLPPRHVLRFFIGAGIATVVLIEGPALALGLGGVILLAYPMVERIASLRSGRRPAVVVGVVVLHLVYWTCFFLPLPAPFRAPNFRAPDGPGVFVLFSGLGLTFFRLISYFADRTWKGAPRLTLGDYLAHMFFFPQFRHGPIERAAAFVPRLRAARQTWTLRDLGGGVARLGLGLLVLFLILPVLSAIRHTLPQEYRSDLPALFAAPETLSLLPVLMLIHGPPIVLYLLESGFASIQLGVSRAFGVRGSENFAQPFLARSPREVWHRWNITLSSWLRDYIYIPLGGSRCPPARRALNILLVFVYCGLLHGPHPRCLAWGLWSGGTLAAYGWIRDLLRRPSPPSANPGRPAVLRGTLSVLARLATFHWFSIGVTIFLDPNTCGYRVLRQYVTLLLRIVGLA